MPNKLAVFILDVIKSLKETCDGQRACQKKYICIYNHAYEWFFGKVQEDTPNDF
jgi:hypothetical protein